MTKNRTKSSDKTAKAPEPMDPSIREVVTATPTTNSTRVCYALETLVSEVHRLFPETPVEYSNYNGRNTALDAMFDLSVLDAEDRVLLVTLLELTDSDARVDTVITHGSEPQVLVSIISNPRTQDSREPFSLADALLVLNEDEDEGNDEGFVSGTVEFEEGSR